MLRKDTATVKRKDIRRRQFGERSCESESQRPATSAQQNQNAAVSNLKVLIFKLQQNPPNWQPQPFTYFACVCLCTLCFVGYVFVYAGAAIRAELQFGPNSVINRRFYLRSVISFVLVSETQFLATATKKTLLFVYNIVVSSSSRKQNDYLYLWIYYRWKVEFSFCFIYFY